MAFDTASGQTNTVVAAMAASSEGEVSGALTPNTYRGLYTSTDAGQTWTYNSLFSGGTAEATSATSVVYNAAAGLFFAALRYHGFYSSPDGLTWTALGKSTRRSGTIECRSLSIKLRYILPHLSRRNHRRPRTQRNVCLVRFS